MEEEKDVTAVAEIKNHGGKRPGAGPKRRHTAPVRMLKVRATEEQWAAIARVLPHDTAIRAAFLADLEKLDIAKLLAELAIDKPEQAAL